MVPGPAESACLGILLEMQITWVPSQTYWISFFGFGDQKSVFYQAPQVILMYPKFKKDQSRVPCISPLFYLVSFSSFLASEELPYFFPSNTTISLLRSLTHIFLNQQFYYPHPSHFLYNICGIWLSKHRAPTWLQVLPSLASVSQYLPLNILRHWRHWLPTLFSKLGGAHVPMGTCHAQRIKFDHTS